MGKLYTEVLIKELPKLDLVIPTSTDMVAVGSIALTAMVVIGTTIFTLYNLKKTIKLQEKMADDRNELEQEKSRKVQISRNRQNWINNLRDNISNYISVIQRVDDHAKTSEIKIDAFKGFDNQSKTQSILSMYDSLDHYRSEAWSLKTRIKLYLNPEEELSKKLITSLNDIYDIATEGSIEKGGHCKYWKKLDEIENLAQKILKIEWERVKKFE